MSARMMRKLQGSPKTVEPKDNEERSDDDDEEIKSGKGNYLNPFDLLNQQQSFSESEVKEDDNETEHASTAANLPTSCGKKKKKRKKKSSKHAGNHISSEDNEFTEKRIGPGDPLLEKVSDSVANQIKSHSKGHTRNQTVSSNLLCVELKHLNSQNEMRRYFGKRVVKVDNKRGRQKVTLRTTYMVTPKESWPPLTKNIITMRPCMPPEPNATTSSNSQLDQMYDEQPQWFAFEHSQYYQSIQNQFLSALKRTDSDFLISLIRRCPYHVDSLIQLSELCRITEDFPLAAELIERVVLVLESSLHLNFSLTSGNCRLDYRRQENRAFFLVLFKHAMFKESMACSRTAFEISKLLLSLSPEDPLAMILVIDYYATRSKQHSWLVKFYEKYDSIRNLSQLPNMAYSYALALHTLGENDKSDDALQYALLMFPGVLRPLLDELSVQTDQRIIASSYFNSEVSGSQSPALHQLICLYVCRAKVIWRQSTFLPWLERNVNVALDRIEQKEELINEFKQKRAARYGAPPRPILRHVILADFKEKVPLAEFLTKEKQPVLAYDPLPPLDSINFYERKSSSSSPTTTTTNRSLSVFFQSLLPSFNLNNAAEEQQNAGGVDDAAGGAAVDNVDAVEDDVAEVDRHLQALNMNLENAAIEGEAAGTESAATYRELTQSLTNVVDAMRDFLQNFRISEHLQTADQAVEVTNSSEEDSSDYFD